MRRGRRRPTPPRETPGVCCRSFKVSRRTSSGRPTAGPAPPAPGSRGPGRAAEGGRVAARVDRPAGGPGALESASA